MSRSQIYFKRNPRLNEWVDLVSSASVLQVAGLPPVILSGVTKMKKHFIRYVH